MQQGSGLLSAFQLEQPRTDTVGDTNQPASEMLEKQLSFSVCSCSSAASMTATPAAESDLNDGPDHFDAQESIRFENFASKEAVQMTLASSPELSFPLMIITAILGGLTILSCKNF